MEKHASGSARWQLVPDEDNPRRMVWAWQPAAEDDIDSLFARVHDGEATPADTELFDACMLDRFISRTYAGEDVEPWIMRALADAFYKVMMGGDWNDELRLPGRPVAPVRSWREQRDLEIYCDVANAINLGGAKVTDAIRNAADKSAVSFETARSAYYAWRDRVSKISIDT